MHMAMVIGGGLVLLGLFLLFGKLWGGSEPDLGLAAKLFAPVWLAMSLTNMWVGVTKAGYSVRDELPILLIVFAVPAAVAGIAIWRMARRMRTTAGGSRSSHVTTISSGLMSEAFVQSSRPPPSTFRWRPSRNSSAPARPAAASAATAIS
jgi:hypothetical protein